MFAVPHNNRVRPRQPDPQVTRSVTLLWFPDYRVVENCTQSPPEPSQNPVLISGRVKA